MLEQLHRWDDEPEAGHNAEPHAQHLGRMQAADDQETRAHHDSENPQDCRVLSFPKQTVFILIQHGLYLLAVFGQFVSSRRLLAEQSIAEIVVFSLHGHLESAHRAALVWRNR